MADCKEKVEYWQKRKVYRVLKDDSISFPILLPNIILVKYRRNFYLSRKQYSFKVYLFLYQINPDEIQKRNQPAGNFKAREILPVFE